MHFSRVVVDGWHSKEGKGFMWKNEGRLPSREYYISDLLVQKEKWSVDIENNKRLIIEKNVLKLEC